MSFGAPGVTRITLLTAQTAPAPPAVDFTHPMIKLWSDLGQEMH